MNTSIRKLSFTKLGLALVALTIVTIGFVYAVLDPMAQACDRTGEICPRYVDMVLAILLISSGIATLFGTLAIPGGQNPDGSFREQRIRLSIAMAVFVVYIIYFGMAVLWYEEPPAIFGTLTDLLKIIVPFYFGSSAVAQVWGSGQNQASDKGNDSK